MLDVSETFIFKRVLVKIKIDTDWVNKNVIVRKGLYCKRTKHDSYRNNLLTGVETQRLYISRL